MSAPIRPDPATSKKPDPLAWLLAQPSDATSTTGTKAHSIADEATHAQRSFHDHIGTDLEFRDLHPGQYVQQPDKGWRYQQEEPPDAGATDSLRHLVQALVTLARGKGPTGNYEIDHTPDDFVPAPADTPLDARTPLTPKGPR